MACGSWKASNDNARGISSANRVCSLRTLGQPPMRNGAPATDSNCPSIDASFTGCQRPTKRALRSPEIGWRIAAGMPSKRETVSAARWNRAIASLSAAPLRRRSTCAWMPATARPVRRAGPWGGDRQTSVQTIRTRRGDCKNLANQLCKLSNGTPASLRSGSAACANFLLALRVTPGIVTLRARHLARGLNGLQRRIPL